MAGTGEWARHPLVEWLAILETLIVQSSLPQTECCGMVGMGVSLVAVVGADILEVEEEARLLVLGVVAVVVHVTSNSQHV